MGSPLSLPNRRDLRLPLRGVSRQWAALPGAVALGACLGGGATLAVSGATGVVIALWWVGTGLAVAALVWGARTTLAGARVQARESLVAQARAESLAVELEALRSDAKDATLARGRFLASLSHELRTPLTAITGYVELLLDTPEVSSDELVRDLGHVRTAAGHLNCVIGDVVELARIEAGRLELVVEPVSVEPLLGRIADTARPVASRQENLLEVTSRAVPHHVVADEARLRQVLLHLVANAARFTDHGTITVTATGTPEGVQFMVTDTGQGIPSDKLAAVFQPFEQLDPTTNRRSGRTGMGLAISRQLLAMMGTELRVASEVGVGTTFSFTLPTGPS
jgi:signal transduction histidine kinase